MQNKSENRICQNCKKDFIIEPDDFGFYEKMEVNVPDLCPECGIELIASLRNEKVVYWRNCEKCGNKTMSLYHNNSPYVVYCHDCWWGDSWDGNEYGKEYKPDKSLINQINDLQKIVPREALIIVNSTNCSYGNNVRDSKDCFFTFLISDCEHVLYSMWMVKNKDCMEDHKVMDSELVIHSVDTANSYKSAFIQDSSDCSDCYFSYDLKGCINCLFCSNLRNKSYYVKNKQVSKEEYQKEFRKVFDGSFKTFLNNLNEFENLKRNTIRRFSMSIKSNNVVGNYMQNCNRSYWCFDGVENQDVRYVASILYSKNTYYSYAIGVQPTEFIFGSCVVKGGSMIKNSFNLLNCSFCTWCDSLISCNNCIACVGLKKREYCILNKQYTKEEYEKVKKKIEDRGELASFMHPRFSMFAYNETASHGHYPLTKEEALKRGYLWQEDIPVTNGKETVLTENIPDNIKDISDKFLKEVFICIDCKRNYKIVAEELKHLREFMLPLPRQCPQCRMDSRKKMRLPFKLWHRNCMCEKENHGHKGSCLNEFKTSYSPDRPEIVYCERCYQQEVY